MLEIHTYAVIHVTAEFQAFEYRFCIAREHEHANLIDRGFVNQEVDVPGASRKAARCEGEATNQRMLDFCRLERLSQSKQQQLDTRFRDPGQDLPWNSSRPISMRRISLVPAPIS